MCQSKQLAPFLNSNKQKYAVKFQRKCWPNKIALFLTWTKFLHFSEIDCKDPYR